MPLLYHITPLQTGTQHKIKGALGTPKYPHHYQEPLFTAKKTFFG